MLAIFAEPSYPHKLPGIGDDEADGREDLCRSQREVFFATGFPPVDAEKRFRPSSLSMVVATNLAERAIVLASITA